MKLFNYKISLRHLAKTFTWRFLATLDTIIIAYFISGNLEFGLQIGTIEIFTKMILYYLHERIWFKSSVSNQKIRHIIKTFSWRFIGTSDTILISLIVIGDFSSGIKIGLFETFTKMFLYFFHEKIWYRINFGLDKNRKLVKTLLNKWNI